MNEALTGVKIKSLYKALMVLDCFQLEYEMGVTQISERLGLYKSNVHDILTTLEVGGYVEKNPQTGKYHLGLHILELSHVITSAMGFRKTIYPHMQNLASELGETVYLGIPDGADVLYLDGAYPAQMLGPRAMLGDRAPMYCTSLGKAMLSYMPEERWNELVPEHLERFTNQTVVDREELFENLRQFRQMGYSVDNMEHEYGITCVGVAILGAHGEPAAAISISGPSPRFDDSHIQVYAVRLKSVADKLGHFF